MNQLSVSSFCFRSLIVMNRFWLKTLGEGFGLLIYSSLPRRHSRLRHIATPAIERRTGDEEDAAEAAWRRIPIGHPLPALARAPPPVVGLAGLSCRFVLQVCQLKVCQLKVRGLWARWLRFEDRGLKVRGQMSELVVQRF